jgi:hypothetical protein
LGGGLSSFERILCHITTFPERKLWLGNFTFFL